MNRVEQQLQYTVTRFKNKIHRLFPSIIKTKTQINQKDKIEDNVHIGTGILAIIYNFETSSVHGSAP